VKSCGPTPGTGIALNSPDNIELKNRISQEYQKFVITEVDWIKLDDSQATRRV